MPPQTLDQILEKRRSQPDQLIEALQDIQENYGYISREAMQAVSQGLGVPLMEVYRVASFYKAFRLKPTFECPLQGEPLSIARDHPPSVRDFASVISH